MLQIHLLKAVQLVEKTMPCTLSKLWTWVVVCFAYLAATLSGAGIGLIVFAFGIKTPVLASITAAMEFLARGYILYKLRGSIFVPLRTGHVKVMLDQMGSDKLIESKEQIERSKKVVENYFTDVAGLAGLERKIRRVLQDIYTKRLDVDRFSFGNEYLKKFLDTLIGILVAFVAEVILAFYLSKDSEDSAATCKKALGLFVQEIDSLTKSVWLLNAFMYLTWIFFTFALLFLINWLTGMLPISFGIWNVVFAMVFAWGLKAIFLESIAVAALIPVFFERIKGKKVSAASEKKLAEMSDAFVELK